MSNNPLLRSLSLLDPSGYFIIALILTLLIAGIVLTYTVRSSYSALERDLIRHAGAGPSFEARVLNGIVQDAQAAAAVRGSDINTQAIIEAQFQSELRPLLIGERFIKASTGLLIILGLVGTFYGLTLSIGKLVALVSGDIANATDITQSLTRGLTQALSGMSVAFSCSLFGILGAIVMTLLGVFANVADRRTSVMVQIEAYLDNELLSSLRGESSFMQPQGFGGAQGGVGGEQLEGMVSDFRTALSQLHATVVTFDAALQNFSSTTRDFREFNLHLKDNVQRMSLSFGDLSDTLKEQVGALRRRD
jgi:hypothetical protein